MTVAVIDHIVEIEKRAGREELDGVELRRAARAEAAREVEGVLAGLGLDPDGEGFEPVAFEMKIDATGARLLHPGEEKLAPFAIQHRGKKRG